MRVEQTTWIRATGWDPSPPGRLEPDAQLVLLFADTAILQEAPLLDTVRAAYPHAQFIGCSTAGEIQGTRVLDDALAVTAVCFERAAVRGTSIPIDDHCCSFAAGTRLAQALDPAGLIHVFVLSDGLHVNGTALVRGLTTHLPPGVTITGGLSADGPRFEETFVLWNDIVSRRIIAAVGLYGAELDIGCGSLGGWDPFGPERVITKSSGNVLYELDGRSALALYRRYLGEHASGLPATGLLFPLSLRTQDGETGVVRTILSVNEAEQSLTFAGDVPEGAYARLMKANFDRLIDGAVGAATASAHTAAAHTARGHAQPPDLAILISCVGRRLVLRQRVEEEVEGVRDVLGPRPSFTGFYSYGEISPFTLGATCELHNQTMTITTIAERVGADAALSAPPSSGCADASRHTAPGAVRQQP